MEVMFTLPLPGSTMQCNANRIPWCTTSTNDCFRTKHVQLKSAAPKAKRLKYCYPSYQSHQKRFSNEACCLVLELLSTGNGKNVLVFVYE